MQHKPKRNMLAMMAHPTPKPDAKPDHTASPAKKHGHPHANLGKYLHKAKKKG
jgi:hypothetical protein